MKFFRPGNLLFCFLSTILFLFLGMVYAGITGAGKGQGLAGGAIVLSYGVVAGGLAFVAAIMSVFFLKGTTVTVLNKLFLIIVVLLFAYYGIRYRDRNGSHRDKPESNPPKATISPVSLVPMAAPAIANEYEPPMGLGMVKLDFYNRKTIYFFGNPSQGKPASEHAPSDSVTFRRTEHGVEIAYAPPWFVPAHMKMDYELLYLRIVSVDGDFFGCIVNETNGQTAYIDRQAGGARYWPDLLLSVNSVERIDSGTNPIRVKPLTHAGLVPVKSDLLKPLRITDEWMMVDLMDDGGRTTGRGWIRWRTGTKLLVTYSLLS